MDILYILFFLKEECFSFLIQRFKNYKTMLQVPDKVNGKHRGVPTINNGLQSFT